MKGEDQLVKISLKTGIFWKLPSRWEKVMMLVRKGSSKSDSSSAST